MKYSITFWAIFFLLPVTLFATEQIPDTLIYDGSVFELSSLPDYPLEKYYQTQQQKRPEFKVGPRIVGSTALHRAYIALWEIEDKRLYLKGIKGFIGDEKVNLKKLFTKNFKRGKVAASWYTGTITIPSGRVIRHHHWEKFRIYENSIILEFKKGIVVRRKIIKNTLPKPKQ